MDIIAPIVVPEALQEIVEEAEKHKLHYINDSIPGFHRKAIRDGFEYFDDKEQKITDKPNLERIESLHIPPAWTDVWVSSDDCGHLQATGKDEKGRKQYLYHPQWKELCQQNKFDKMIFFSEVLPEIRSEIRAGLEEPTLSERHILATLLWLLDKTFLRIGNQEYAEENNSYGLTTLRSKHVDIDGKTVTFEFKGKSGVFHTFDITHPKIVRTIRRLEELPGYELFQYVDEEKKRHHIDSQNVNDYLKKITGEDITAKDFRTWGGTVFAASYLVEIGPFENKKQAQKNITQAVKQVSKHLHNTPKVCRSYYIHPVIPKTYEEKELIPYFEKMKGKKEKKTRGLSFNEFAVAELIKAKGN